MGGEGAVGILTGMKVRSGGRRGRNRGVWRRRCEVGSRRKAIKRKKKRVEWYEEG